MELQWPLILFTFFLCLCGGILAFQGLLTFLGKGKETQKLALIVAFIALVIGGISVFTHLQHWERIFNGFSALLVGKGEYGMSGIGLEMWGCVIFVIVEALYFLFMRRSEEGVPPKWCAVLAMAVGIALPVVTGDSYLMAALPAWNTPLLILYYLMNTLVMGALSMMIISNIVKCTDSIEVLGKIAFFSIAIQALVLIIYAIYITSMGGSWTEVQYYFDPTIPDTHMVDEVASTAMVTGTRGIVFWLVVIVLGSLGPLGALFMIKKQNVEDAAKKRLYYIVALVLVIVAGIVWRCLLYQVAISAFAMY